MQLLVGKTGEAIPFSVDELNSLIRKSALFVTRRMYGEKRVALIDELMSEGWLAAMRAIDRYEPEKGYTFHTFVGQRLQGQMVDYIRWTYHCEGHTRAKGKKFYFFSFDHGEFEENDKSIQGVALTDPSPSQHDVFADEEEREVLLSIAETSRERMIVKMRLEGKTLREVADKLGVNESRASQLQARFICKAKTKLKELAA